MKDQHLAYALLDFPETIEYGSQQIQVYPPSIGIRILADTMMSRIEINQEVMKQHPSLELLALAEKYPDEITTIVALYTFKNRRDAMDVEKLETRIEELSMSTEDLAVAYTRVRSFSRGDDYMEEFGIIKEIERRKKIIAAKADSHHAETGAVSIYGELIDPACERYGWTLDYILWDISYHNLRLLMSDISNSIYLSDDEYKKARKYLSRNKTDDSHNKEKFAEFFKDMN